MILKGIFFTLNTCTFDFILFVNHGHDLSYFSLDCEAIFLWKLQLVKDWVANSQTYFSKPCIYSPSDLFPMILCIYRCRGSKIVGRSSMGQKLRICLWNIVSGVKFICSEKAIYPNFFELNKHRQIELGDFFSKFGNLRIIEP